MKETTSNKKIYFYGNLFSVNLAQGHYLKTLCHCDDPTIL